MASYFISYSWSRGNGAEAGHGCTSIEVDGGGIESMTEIQTIQKKMEEGCPELGKVIVLNWKRFENQGEDNG